VADGGQQSEGPARRSSRHVGRLAVAIRQGGRLPLVVPELRRHGRAAEPQVPPARATQQIGIAVPADAVRGRWPPAG